MPRLLGVEIPGDKRIEASLPYIFGIGPSNTKRILETANIDPNVRAKELSPEQINSIIHAINSLKIVIEGDLRRETQGNLKRLQAINCYRGIRHRRGSDPFAQFLLEPDGARRIARKGRGLVLEFGNDTQRHLRANARRARNRSLVLKRNGIGEF